MLNITSQRNRTKEQETGVHRWYDIIEKRGKGLSEMETIGSVLLRREHDMQWRINSPDSEPFGDFIQCVTELKIQSELQKA